MKYKIGLVIISILIIILTIFYVDYRKSNKEITNNKERTKIEYIFGNLSYNQALTIGEDKFLKTIKSRSKFDYEVDVDSSDSILTLSSCYDKNKRVVLHAKLISNEKRNWCSIIENIYSPFLIYL